MENTYELDVMLVDVADKVQERKKVAAKEAEVKRKASRTQTTQQSSYSDNTANEITAVASVMAASFGGM